MFSRLKFFQWLNADLRPKQPMRPGRYYNRTGECHLCGACCTNIYLVHNNKTIQDPEEFERLKPDNPEYEYFKIIAETENGLRFQCIHLQADNTCGIYENRPTFCKRYPTEEVLLLGGVLAENCGYQFSLRQTFDEVLNQTAGRKTLKPEKAKSLLLRPGITDQPLTEPLITDEFDAVFSEIFLPDPEGDGDE